MSQFSIDLKDLNGGFEERTRGFINPLSFLERLDVTIENNEGFSFKTMLLLSRPDFRSLWESNYNPVRPSLPELLSLPRESLGYACGKLIVETNVNQGVLLQNFPSNPIQYLSFRLRQSRVFWQAVTGFQIDLLGLLSLQAFSVAQVEGSTGGSKITEALKWIETHQPSLTFDAFVAIQRGFEIGRKSEFLLSVKWEEMLDIDLEELRASLRIR